MRYAFRTVPGIPSVPSVAFSATLFDKPKPGSKTVVSTPPGNGGGCAISNEFSLGWGSPPDENGNGTDGFAQAGYEIVGGLIEPVPATADLALVAQWTPIAYSMGVEATYTAEDQNPPSVRVDALGVITATIQAVRFAISPWHISRGVFKIRLFINGAFARNILTISVGPGGAYSEIAWTVDIQ